MMHLDDDALSCDLAETYHIYDYRQLPAYRVAVFAIGLRDDARIKLQLQAQSVPLETLLLAGMFDRLSLLVWAQTKDGQKGVRQPKSIVDQLLSSDSEKSEMVFHSGEDFDKYREALIRDMGGENGWQQS